MLRSLGSLITSILLLFSLSGKAQSVGVVMSGGGAKGLYHIGVIEALEDNGIPIDYVAGTSMGSIIAGLYAAGYSPADMREIVASGEIKQWMMGKIDNSYGAYYRQYREIPALVSLRLDPKNLKPVSEEVPSNMNQGIDINIQQFSKQKSNTLRDKQPSSTPSMLYIPNSLMSPTQTDMALTRLFTPASESANRNFSNLMVPFLCLASDISNNTPVVFTSGNLAEAIRASMALPIIFEPVIKGDAVLYDGGLYDNFPWKSMQAEFSPDVMVGSICNNVNTKISPSSSLIDQFFAITTDESDYTLPEGNITIQRDVPVGMVDFEHGLEVIDLGYEDTVAKMDSIKRTIKRRCSPEFYEQRRAEFKSKVKPFIFEKYEISGVTNEQKSYVQDFLHTSATRGGVLQREMPYSELEENLFKILSSGDFTTKFPKVTYNKLSERYNFNIALESKPQLKLSLGGHLSSTAFNQIFLSLNHKSVKRVAQSLFADLYLGAVSTSFIAGGRTDFYLKRPLFIDYYGSTSTKNLKYGNLGNVTTTTNTERVKTNDSHISIAVGMPISRRSMVSFRANSGITTYYYDPLSVSSSQVVEQYNLYDRTRLGFAGGKLEYQRNTLNRIIYPQSGSKIEISTIGIVGLEHNYQTSFNHTAGAKGMKHNWYGARVKYQKYINPPTESWFSLGVSVDAVYTNLNKFGNPTATMLMMPSYQPVLHSKLIYMPDFSADAFIGAGVMPTFNILPELLLRTGFYGMYRNEYKVGGVEPGLISSQKMHYLGEAAFVYHTSLGAISLSLTKYEIDSWNDMYLTFGFGVPLFAPKGIFY